MLTKEQMRKLEEFVRADGQEWPGDPRRKQARQLYQLETLPGVDYPVSEAQRSAMLPAVGKAVEPPEGPGTRPNKPLMRKGEAQTRPARMGIAGNTFSGLLAFFSRVPQLAPPWRWQARLNVAEAAVPQETMASWGRGGTMRAGPTSDSKLAAPAREVGAVFCPVCFWCLVEVNGRLPIGIVTLSDCPRHRSVEGRAKVHGL